jgi:hypothetical protein
MFTHKRKLYRNPATGEKLTRVEKIGAERGPPAGFEDAGELGRMDLAGSGGGMPLSDAVREASYRPDLQPLPKEPQ